MESLVNIGVALEVLAALVVIWLDVREFRFLRSLRPFLPEGESMTLYEALMSRAAFVTLVGGYLIVLSAATVVLGSLAVAFPPLRVINGALFLGLLAGPIYIGRALRHLSPREEG